MPTWMKWAVSFAIGIGVIALGWKWYPVLITLHVLLCFALILVVLLQSGKAADLAGAFGGAGSQTAFGPRGAATFLSQATSWCAIMFVLTSVSLVKRQSQLGFSSGGTGSVLEQTAPASTPAPTTPAPQQTPTQTPSADQQTPSAGQQQLPPAQNPPSQPKQ